MAEDTLALGRPRSGPLRSPSHRPRRSARPPRRIKSEVSLQLATLRDKTSGKQCRDDFDVSAAGRVAKLMQKKATKMIFPHGADSVAESRKDADTSDRSGSNSSREAPLPSASSSGWMAALFPTGSDADADAALVADAENLFGSDAWATEVAMHAAVDEGVKRVFDEADGAAGEEDPPVWVAGLFPSASDEGEAVENKNAAGDDDAAEKVFEDATAVLKDIQSHERAASVDSLEQILGAGAQNAYHRPARKKWSVGNGSLFHGLEADEMLQTPPTMYDLASRDMEKNLPKIEKEARTEEAKAKAAKIKKMLKKPPREEKKKKKPTPTIMDIDALDLNVQSRFERLASSLTEDDVSVTDDDEADIDFIEEMDITFGGKAFDAFAEFMANQWESLVEKE